MRKVIIDMFCTNCGNKLEDSALFCTSCGAPRENTQKKATPTQNTQNNAPTESTITTKPPKKSKKKIFVILGACIVLLLAGGVTGYFLYQRHIMKQADNVMAYLEDNKYHEALELYEKYIEKAKNTDFEDKISDRLLDISEQTKEEYLSENINYYTAIGRLKNIDDYGIREVDDSISKASRLINKIKTSRESYYEGKDHYAIGEYLDALDNYNLVIKEDKKYYDLARKEIEFIEQEIAEKERNEQIEDIRAQALSDAADYADWSYYEEAIEVLEQGLSLIPGDAQLTNQLDIYYNYLIMSTQVPSFTSDKFEYTYKENNIDIMTVSIEVPILEGDLPGYDIINQTFQEIKEGYINAMDETAEDARYYIYEEYFIPYTYDVAYTALYNNNGILCIVMEGYVFTGGAHGYPIRSALTFNLITGDYLWLDDLLMVDNETFAYYITEEFKLMYNEAPEEYWEDAISIVENDSYNMYNYNFYITEDCLAIYYYPYDLASYARGFVDIIIPYENNEWMFSFLQ